MFKLFFVFLIRVYQKAISPIFPPSCRFYPSCSQYCILSIQQYGTLKGLYKCARRLGRCHPYHPGGVDFP